MGSNLIRLGEEEEGRQSLEIGFDNDPFNVMTSNMLKVFDSPVAYTVPRNIKEPKQRGSLYLVKATKKNLEASIAGETHEYTDMYPGMAKTARDEGFDEIADWFETLAKAERSHANRFQKALDNLDD